MKQVYHHYLSWEDYKAGMWRKVSKDEEPELLKLAIEFTGNHLHYGNAMLRVIKEWKFSCEHNLTNLSINRKAWIGHAACALEKNLPEYIVRSAWSMLTDEQRFLANRQADNAISKYFDSDNKEIVRMQLSIW